MRRLLMDHLQKERERLVGVIGTEPGAKERFREIDARWKELKLKSEKTEV